MHPPPAAGTSGAERAPSDDEGTNASQPLGFVPAYTIADGRSFSVSSEHQPGHSQADAAEHNRGRDQQGGPEQQKQQQQQQLQQQQEQQQQQQQPQLNLSDTPSGLLLEGAGLAREFRPAPPAPASASASASAGEPPSSRDRAVLGPPGQREGERLPGGGAGARAIREGRGFSGLGERKRKSEGEQEAEVEEEGEGEAGEDLESFQPVEDLVASAARGDDEPYPATHLGGDQRGGGMKEATVPEGSGPLRSRSGGKPSAARSNSRSVSGEPSGSRLVGSGVGEEVGEEEGEEEGEDQEGEGEPVEEEEVASGLSTLAALVCAQLQEDSEAQRGEAARGGQAGAVGGREDDSGQAPSQLQR
eukprot:TRINITY_DN898_c1_g1_i1.p2 TRINITY_DN898_c1_g1~~TRINITY_DN898_c1_g1_i1.p2  ORF type:complete len:360 (-),score=146.10 TRINITY_DN898_c1_g1_i1:342-1421(-)